MRKLACEPPDGRRRHAAAPGHGFRRVSRVEIAHRQALEDGDTLTPIRQTMPAQEAAGRQRGPFAVAGVEAVIRLARRLDREPAGIGQAGEILEIDPLGPQ
jgi:hypothetical protein